MTATLPAIRKGDTLLLLKPLDGVPDGAPVMVTICTDDDRGAWYRGGDDHFDLAFGEDEPDYLADETAND